MLVLEEHLGSDKVSCVIRTGSPAHTAYTARPVYVSEAWLKKNPTTLISSQPTGTGQYDYAVIAINGAGAYAAITPTASVPSVDDTVYLGTYGAQGLTSTEVRNALYPTLTTSDVVRFYTFSSGNGADVIALTGNEAAKQGSSGGAVVNANGRLIGIVTTSDTKGDVADREIRAITIRYIERDFENTTGKSFDSYFSDTSVTTLVNSYAPTVQTLGAFLAHAIGLE
jgi:CBS domain-containing protein